MRDMLNNTEVVHLGNLTLSGATPAASGYVDLDGYQACTILVVSNTITDAGTAAGFTATLQESADTTALGAGSVAAKDAVGGTVTVAVTADDDDNKISGVLGYIGAKRYAGISVTGTVGTDADVSVFAVLQKPREAPVSPTVGAVVART